ncbi:MAG: biopolymer transporter ExbD [Pseudobdellovibrio sp.]
MARKSKETIGKPGYHLQPKYDLHFLRKKRNYHGKKSAVPELPLVSLIDMFTILVIFLLMNFSTDGESYFVPKAVKLPLATNGKPLQSAPLLSLSANEVIFEVQKVPGIEGMTITADIGGDLNQIVSNLTSLKQTITQNLKAGETFKGQINIQADENLKLELVKKVMKICVQNGWGSINFAVRTGE